MTIRCSQFQMITGKRDGILVALFWGHYGKEHHLFLWLLEKMESTQHFWCLDGERGGKLVWRDSLYAVGCTSLGPVGCLGTACLLLRNTQPRLASGLPAATTLTRLSGLCPFGSVVEWSKAKGFFELQRYPFSSAPVSEFDGWTSCSLRFVFFVLFCFIIVYCSFWSTWGLLSLYAL